jgi:hypothetical protein
MLAFMGCTFGGVGSESYHQGRVRVFALDTLITNADDSSMDVNSGFVEAPSAHPEPT